MAESKNLARYKDCEDRLNQVLEDGPIQITFPSHAKAIRWRHRAYTFRSLWRKKMEEVYSQSTDPNKRNAAGTTPWDDFVITIKDNVLDIDCEEPFDGTVTLKKSD